MLEKLRTELLAEHRAALDKLLASFTPRNDIERDVVFGKTFLEVIRTVLRDGHDLVMKPAEDPAWTRKLFGSDDMHLLRKCPVPIWLLKQKEKTNYENILATVDFDPWTSGSVEQPLNREIMELAASLAISDFAALHVVHAWDAPAEMLLRTWTENSDETSISYLESERARHRNGVDRLCELLRTEVGKEAFEYLSPKIYTPQSPPYEAIPATVNAVNADLVVMGTVGRSGIPGLLIGNTAETVLDQLQCSVLAIKPPGFETPIKPAE